MVGAGDPTEAAVQVLIIGREGDYGVDFVESFAALGVDWQLVLLPDVSAALHRMQADPPDVVVCDLRPVGMEGGALLDRAKAFAPKAARIMLLEERDAGQAMRLLGSAHRLLHKPLRAEELIEAVDSIVELQELLGSEALRAAIGRVDRLPPPPKLYLQLSQAVNDPNASLAQIAGLVQQDPATAARVLRVCNSAYFSSGRNVADVRTAVIRLGQQELRRIVLASEVFRDSADGADCEAMRLRSLKASQLAARIIDSASAEMAATAALLAEVGLLLPGVRVPDGRGGWRGDGPHYAEAGAFLLGMWGLPMPIVEAVAHHCHPGRSRARGFWMVGAVHVACALAGGREVDLAYLEQAGVAARLPGWRKLAAELGAAQVATPDASAGVEPPAAEAHRRAAMELLAGQPGAKIEDGQVSFQLLGYVQGDSRSADAVDAALQLQAFDAVAVDLCSERLQHLRGGQPVAAPGWWTLLFGRQAALQLGRYLLDAYRQWRAEVWGSDPLAAACELVEGAQQRQYPVWAVDLPLDVLLGNELGHMSPFRRIHHYLHCQEVLRSGPGDSPLPRTQGGDLLQAAWDALLPGQQLGRQSLYPERLRHVLAELRRRAAASGARRVLVLTAAAHVPALRRGFRDSRGAAG